MGFSKIENIYSKYWISRLYIDVFERTLKMSTYLLAVAVLEDYDFVKRTTKKTDNVIEVNQAEEKKEL